MRRFTSRLMITAAAITTCAALPAMAQTAQNINYSLTGTFAGTINGNSFNSVASLLGIGNESNPTGSLTSFQAMIGGSTYTATNPIAFFNNGQGTAGFTNNSGNGGDIFDFIGVSSSFNGTSNLTPTSVTNAFPNITYPSFVSNGGTVAFTGGTNLIFSAAITAAPIVTPPVTTAVPEPATWAMMILGMGAVGYAMRRRHSIRVSYAA